MRRAWFARLNAVLSAAVLLGGGGMPALDLLLYHWVKPAHADQLHVEATADPLCHAERCSLGWAQPVPRIAGAVDCTLRIIPATFRREPGPRIVAPPTLNAGTLHHSRAPPARAA